MILSCGLTGHRILVWPAAPAFEAGRSCTSRLSRPIALYQHRFSSALAVLARKWRMLPLCLQSSSLRFFPIWERPSNDVIFYVLELVVVAAIIDNPDVLFHPSR